MCFAFVLAVGSFFLSLGFATANNLPKAIFFGLLCALGIALFVKADNAEDLLRKQKEEKRQRERHEAAERIEQQRRDRFRTLEARYGDDVLFASRNMMRY